MNAPVLVDSSAWIALINKDDNYHKAVADLMRHLLDGKHRLITTDMVIVETINAMSKIQHRNAVIGMIERIEKSPGISVVKITDDIYEAAWSMYKRRKDKEWGITDCASFEVMKLYKVRRAFTLDHHFEQAGFNVMLKDTRSS